jgi:hypothetical protein
VVRLFDGNKSLPRRLNLREVGSGNEERNYLMKQNRKAILWLATAICVFICVVVFSWKSASIPPPIADQPSTDHSVIAEHLEGLANAISFFWKCMVEVFKWLVRLFFPFI